MTHLSAKIAKWLTQVKEAFLAWELFPKAKEVSNYVSTCAFCQSNY